MIWCFPEQFASPQRFDPTTTPVPHCRFEMSATKSFEPAALVFESLEAPSLVHLEAAILLAPPVERGFSDAVATAQTTSRSPPRMLLR